MDDRGKDEDRPPEPQRGDGYEPPTIEDLDMPEGTAVTAAGASTTPGTTSTAAAAAPRAL